MVESGGKWWKVVESVENCFVYKVITLVIISKNINFKIWVQKYKKKILKAPIESVGPGMVSS